jgi:serine/threonine-protein phosphatase 2A regulatory subunit B''
MQHPNRIIEQYRNEIKQSIITSKRKLIPSDTIFYEIASLLSHKTCLNYREYKTLREVIPAVTLRFFTASDFLKLPRDKNGCVEVEVFLRRLQRTLDVETTFLDLASYASSTAYITEEELERYIYDIISQIGSLEKLPDSFKPFYVFTASKRFFFFLDPKRTKRISILKLGELKTALISIYTLCTLYAAIYFIFLCDVKI